VKICKTCRFWSLEKKGFCQRDHRGVGQFWHCEYWLAGDEAEKAQAEGSCQMCAPRIPRGLRKFGVTGKFREEDFFLAGAGPGIRDRAG
jgi:hypothetical protein